VARHGLDVLIVIGGDGTMTTADRLARRGVPCIGVPKTIDNDLVGTDLTFGFLTAVATATDALDRVHTTAASHHRVIAVELMGRNAGWIALHAGVAAAADVILIPEIEFSLESVAASIEARARRGREFSIIAVSEGARPRGGQPMVARVDPTSPDPIRLGGVGRFVAERIEAMTGVESRHVVLGHVQRGGPPIAADRVLATQFGWHALELLRAGQTGRMVTMQGLQLGDVALSEPAGRQRKVPPGHHLVAAARSVGVCFGD
jgi:6-phosphofructokinase 1